MKVVFYSPTPLPVKKYGGTERILFWHMKELARQGHQVILIGPAESEVASCGITLLPSLNKDFRSLIPRDADILHLTFQSSFKFDLPVLFNHHGNASAGDILSENTVYVSGRHAKIHQAECFLYNALDFSEYPFEPKILKWEKFLFLAKASWSVKNLKACKEVCGKAKKHLHIIGGRAYSLNPRLHSHGFLGGEAKLQVMKQCDALLFPVQWHEPFGIAVIEAMALGLPVLSSAYGSLPELITPQVGRVCETRQQLLELLQGEQPYFNCEEIRSYVQSKFNIRQYSEKMIGFYETIIAGKKLNTQKGKAPIDQGIPIRFSY